MITVYAVRIRPNIHSTAEQNELPFLGLVKALRERQASVAHDKAFSLNGVFRGLGITTLDPNYTQTAGETYHRLFLDLLRRKPSLINLLIDVGPNLSGVPSWVPDWSSFRERCWLPDDYVYNMVELYGHSFPEPQMKISDRELGLWSLLKGHVVFHTNGSAIHSLANWMQEARNAAPASKHISLDSLRISIYEALLGRSSGPADRIDYESFSLFYEKLERIPVGEFHDERLLLTHLTGTPAYTDFINRCLSTIGRRRAFFVTNDGHIGSGPINMEENDRLGLLRGVAVPMVLRPSVRGPDIFSVVGAAYVHGLMDLSDFNGTNHGRNWQAVYLI